MLATTTTAPAPDLIGLSPLLILAVLGWVFFGALTHLALRTRGKPGCAALLLGVLLGPIGLVIALVTVAASPKPDR